VKPAPRLTLTTARIINVAAHEYAETQTDEFPSTGWADCAGSNIGDKCAWSARSATATFSVQLLWSNGANAKTR